MQIGCNHLTLLPVIITAGAKVRWKCWTHRTKKGVISQERGEEKNGSTL